MRILKPRVSCSLQELREWEQLRRVLLCRSSASPPHFLHGYFLSRGSLHEGSFLGMKEDKIVLLKFETWGNCRICSKFVTPSAELGSA